MDDQLSELLRSLKAAEDILQADSVKNGDDTHSREAASPQHESEPAPPRHDEERKIALGDVAKARKDYEREPMDGS